jgi:P27 family predicted phage terminase small subunit
MPGPRPTPTLLKIVRGNPSKRRLNANEPTPPIPPEPPEPPGFLMPTAKDEWYRIVPTLHAVGLVSVIDVMPLAAYCQSCARWQQAENMLAEMAERDPDTGALTVTTGTGSLTQNPVLRIAVSAAQDMLKFAAEFGLTPSARVRVANSYGARLVPSKFEGLLRS